MSIKQRRYGIEQLSASQGDLLHETCSVIFINGSSLLVRLTKFDSDSIHCMDMFRKKRKFPLNEIVEIIKEIRN